MVASFGRELLGSDPVLAWSGRGLVVVLTCGKSFWFGLGWLGSWTGGVWTGSGDGSVLEGLCRMKLGAE